MTNGERILIYLWIGVIGVGTVIALLLAIFT